MEGPSSLVDATNIFVSKKGKDDDCEQASKQAGKQTGDWMV